MELDLDKELSERCKPWENMVIDKSLSIVGACLGEVFQREGQDNDRVLWELLQGDEWVSSNDVLLTNSSMSELDWSDLPLMADVVACGKNSWVCDRAVC